MNHSARAQDLLAQHLAEWDIDLAVVAEPYYVPPRNNWKGDASGTVTIIEKTGNDALPLSQEGSGDGYVAVKWGEIVIVGMYFSPNKSPPQFEEYLNRVAEEIRRHIPGSVLAMGDLNAKAEEWGSPSTDARGEVLAEWGAELDLLILNRGNSHTCVRHNGGSIVDITMGSPQAACMVTGWRVLEGSETLSDHRYIRMEISDPSMGKQRRPSGRREGPLPPRWALKRLDGEAMAAAAEAKAWEDSPPPEALDVEEEAAWFLEAMTQICDASMPRIRAATKKRGVYWWTQEISGLRKTSIELRHRYTHYRRRRHTEEEATALWGEYTDAKKSLQTGHQEG